jgi:hypothetical protein
MLKLLKRFSTYTLLVALVISAISAYYSIVGLTAIFAAAVVPIIIMGGALESGKLVAAVWLKLNWQRANLIYKFYLVPAVAFLMVLTSMGIFGFLSKAHSDQALVSGDVQSKIAIYDEKIKVARENIEADRKQLKQMDEAVDQVMGRSQDEKGADKANAIRKSQQRDRLALAKDIEANQTLIAKLNDEASPIRAEVRKVEADVGPIKYIAALIYNDNPDANVLEKAVRFVIIMIVAVFDPLALVLILAAQQSMRWERQEEEDAEKQMEEDVENFFKRGREHAKQLDQEAAEHAAKVIGSEESTDSASSTTNTENVEPEVIEPVVEEVVEQPKVEEQEDTRPVFERFPYLAKPFSHFESTKPLAYKGADEVTWPVVKQQQLDMGEPEHTADADKSLNVYDDERLVSNFDKKILAAGVDSVDRPGDYLNHEPVIQTSNVTSELKMFDPRDEYVSFEGKTTSIEALKHIRPDLILPLNGKIPNKFTYGDVFPRESLVGDMYMRVETKPHRLYKFNGMEWMHVDKKQNTSYLSNENYVRLLIEKLNNGEYLPEMLTEQEEDEIKAFLEK